jgi:hypothetical protein
MSLTFPAIFLHAERFRPLTYAEFPTSLPNTAWCGWQHWDGPLSRCARLVDISDLVKFEGFDEGRTAAQFNVWRDRKSERTPV